MHEPTKKTRFKSPAERRMAMQGRGMAGPQKWVEEAIFKRFFGRMALLLGKNPDVARANKNSARLFWNEFNRMAAKCALDEMLVAESGKRKAVQDAIAEVWKTKGEALATLESMQRIGSALKGLKTIDGKPADFSADEFVEKFLEWRKRLAGEFSKYFFGRKDRIEGKSTKAPKRKWPTYERLFKQFEENQ